MPDDLERALDSWHRDREWLVGKTHAFLDQHPTWKLALEAVDAAWTDAEREQLGPIELSRKQIAYMRAAGVWDALGQPVDDPDAEAYQNARPTPTRSS
jgi:hypothetical protein